MDRNDNWQAIVNELGKKIADLEIENSALLVNLSNAQIENKKLKEELKGAKKHVDDLHKKE